MVQRLPVLYWLHGTGGGVAGIRPLAQFFDEAIEAGRVPPMTVVFVNGPIRERMVELGIAHAWIELAGIGHDPRAVLEGLVRVDGDFYRQALAQAALPARP